MELKIRKEKVLEAAKKCKDAKGILKTMFPEAFEGEVETYEDICEKLFSDQLYWITESGGIEFTARSFGLNTNLTNASSKKQLEKLLAINKLMNIAKYLNDGWVPDFSDHSEWKYTISITTGQDKEIELHISSIAAQCTMNICFKTPSLAEKAIKILGEEEIRLALCTDY